MTSALIPPAAIRRTSPSGTTVFKGTLDTSVHGQRRRAIKVVLLAVLNRTILQDWSETETVFQASPEDFRAPVPPGYRDRIGSYVDVYTNGCMKYPFAQDAYFMMPSFLYHWDCKEIPSERQINFPDTCDVRLLTSRDGINWCYAGGRKPFLRLGGVGQSLVADDLRSTRRCKSRRGFMALLQGI